MYDVPTPVHALFQSGNTDLIDEFNPLRCVNLEPNDG